MNRIAGRNLICAVFLLSSIAGAFVSCDTPNMTQLTDVSLQAARPGDTNPVSVSSVNPASAAQGDANVQITIGGAGFEPGAQASWERNGKAYQKIAVSSTDYVSPSQVVATISIAADADLGLFDVAVTNPNRKKGISTESFAVTQSRKFSIVSVTPSYGRPGDANLDVVISGSAFTNGAQAAWLRNGALDPAITVHETSFISASELRAAITIAPDAELGFRDVMVTNPDGFTGTLARAFEVTNVIVLGTNSTLSGFATGVNSSGEVVGWWSSTSGFYWSQGTGMMPLALLPYSIDESGTVIAGLKGSRAAVVYKVAGGWSEPELLPYASLELESNAYRRFATLEDASLAISGREMVYIRGKKWTWTAALWRRPAGASWERTLLPIPAGMASADGWAVNRRGEVAGNAIPPNDYDGRRAVLWNEEGVPQFLAPAPSNAWGMNVSGTIIVGEYAGRAVYFTNNNGTWSGPIFLDGACPGASAVDEAGNIAGNSCIDPNGRKASVMWRAPDYRVSHVSGGIGGQVAFQVRAISPTGGFLVGTSYLPSGSYLPSLWPDALR